MTDVTSVASEVPTLRARNMPRGFLLEIGASVFPVYGDATIGWSISRSDISDESPYRYATLDELMFALLNFTLVADGSA